MLQSRRHSNQPGRWWHEAYLAWGRRCGPGPWLFVPDRPHGSACNDFL